ncbi:hypothetical protein SAMN04489761_0310 [Tenacibaculum sp. MAR_2009_124]|uniref:hypothetical protein n=1 Tax=Tenacibaculum sp. MAR_2009_124 TaxID=1250059 RepID=UPI00089923DE|nr:hypothetical protein [Tenacibaculum sp. MAR_2009_124]SEB38130.1 hypothetical protein SAMN04489761_0310 [Tenacibaculum sp. MAR_2009_124]
MKKVIVDYTKLTTNILNLLVKKYPDGYDYDDIITFQNVEGLTINAIEVSTEDTAYFVKINTKLERTMANYVKGEGTFNSKEIGLASEY